MLKGFKDVMAAGIVGHRVCRDKVKGGAWSTDEIKRGCRREDSR